MVSVFGLFLNNLKSSTANSWWRPSSREISSFEKQRPGMSPLFLSQKIAQNEPEKNIPSTHANANRRSAKERDFASNHFIAHCAFFSMHGTVWIASNNCFFSAPSLMYLSMSFEYVSPCTISLWHWYA